MGVFDRRLRGFRSAALSLLLLPWFCLAPTARAGTIDFNVAETGTGSIYQQNDYLSWSSGSSWLGGVPPAAGDDVYLISLWTQSNSEPGTGTVMNFDAGTLTLSSLTVNENCCQTMSLLLPDTTALTAGSETVGAYGDIYQSGGSNTVTGTLGLTGFYEMYGGTLSANAINNSGIFQFYGGGAATYQTFTNQGSWFNFGTAANNQSGATFTNELGGRMSNESGSLNNLAGGTIANTGVNTTLSNFATLTNTGTGAYLSNLDGATLNNGGGDGGRGSLLNQSGATLTNDGASTSLKNSNGSTLTNDGAGTILDNQNAATLTNTGAGTILNNQNQATLTNTSAFNNVSGGYVINTGVGTNFNNQGGAVLTNDHSTGSGTTYFKDQAGATFTNDASIIYNQNLAQFGIDGAGTSLTNQNGAQIVNQTGAAFSVGAIQSGATLTNNDSSIKNLTSGLLVNYGAGTNFYNQNGATLTNDGAGSATGATLFVNQAGAVLTNTGAGTNFNNQNGARVTNDGATIKNLDGAILTNTGAGTAFANLNGATMTNDSASIINNLNGASLTMSGGSLLTNNGTLNNSGSVETDSSGNINGTGTYTQTAGSTMIGAGTSFAQCTLNLQGGSFTVDGSATVSCNATNSGGNLTISGPGANLTVAGSYTQTGAGSKTLLAGGTFDPPAIDIEGGTFGGTGTVDGPVMLTDDSTLQVGNPTGELLISGDYSQNGGDIVFEVQSDGNGGFLESTLGLGSGLDINGVDIVFDFENGALPAAFSDAGLFNIATFFTGINDAALLADFAGFSGDTFTLEGTSLQTIPGSLDKENGDLTFSAAASAPEPGSLFLLLPGLAFLGLIVRRQRRYRLDYFGFTEPRL